MSRVVFAFYILCLALSLSNFGSAFAATPTCDRPWLFFDLGNTLVDTRDWSHVTYLPEAQAYLARLKAHGYSLGLIANIPEEWGATEAEKVEALKTKLAKDWTGTEPFDWSQFSRVLVPLTNAERKPAPVLFLRAQAAAGDCPTIYQGEDPAEVLAAENLGMKGYQVGKPGRPYYLPESDFLYFLTF